VFVAFTDDFIKVIGRRMPQRFETPVIQNKEIGFEIVGQLGVPGTIRMANGQMAEQLWYFDEKDIESPAASLVGQGGGQMGFANTRRADEKDGGGKWLAPCPRKCSNKQRNVKRIQQKSV